MTNSRSIRATPRPWWKWIRSDDPILPALAASLLLHTLAFAFIEVGRRDGWWRTDREEAALLAGMEGEEPAGATPRRKPVELVFVDVAPSQATEEKPEQPEFQAARNSLAANPEEAVEEEEQPKIDGEQERIIKSIDVAEATPPVEVSRPQPAESSPAPVAAEPEPAPEPVEPLNLDRLQPAPLERTAPRELEPARDEAAPLKLAPRVTVPAATGSDAAEEKPAPETKPRPRTLAQYVQQNPEASELIGQKMRQDGGVKRRSVQPSFDAVGTPFGEYDSLFIAAVQRSWYRLLDESPEARKWSGHVVVKFRLYFDGRITHMVVDEDSSADEMQAYICERAIHSLTPFDPWPAELRRLTDKDYRELRFRFYYN